MRKMFILAVVAFGLLLGLSPSPASAVTKTTHAAVKTSKTHAGKAHALKKKGVHKKHVKKHKKHKHVKKTKTTTA